MKNPLGSEYANCAHALADFVAIPGAKGPTCKKNGLWAAKQCNGSILGGACTCSNPWGEEIPCPDKDPVKVLQRHVTEVTGVLEGQGLEILNLFFFSDESKRSLRGSKKYNKSNKLLKHNENHIQ